MSETLFFILAVVVVGAVIMALQRSLMEQSDIVPVLQGLDFVPTDEGLVVKNPPTFKVESEGMALFEEDDGVEDSLIDETASE